MQIYRNEKPTPALTDVGLISPDTGTILREAGQDPTYKGALLRCWSPVSSGSHIKETLHEPN